ncbi:MAG: hypothetical protein HEQ32_05825 [Vampirovibrio sp.]
MVFLILIPLVFIIFFAALEGLGLSPKRFLLFVLSFYIIVPIVFYLSFYIIVPIVFYLSFYIIVPIVFYYSCPFGPWEHAGMGALLAFYMIVYWLLIGFLSILIYYLFFCPDSVFDHPKSVEKGKESLVKQPTDNIEP